MGDPNLRGSKTFIDFLQENDDDRLYHIYKKETGATEYLSLIWGDRLFTDEDVNNKLARGVWNPTQPVYFFTLPEVNFLIAEALVRYPSLSGDAKEFYDAGVTTSFALFTADVSPADPTEEGAQAAELLAGPYAFPVDGSVEEKLNAIITQKWVAQAKFNPLESFFDFNRTGYPATFTSDGPVPLFTYSANSAIGDKFPRRLLFPQRERDSNQNTPDQVNIDVPVWWAK